MHRSTYTSHVLWLSFQIISTALSGIFISIGAANIDPIKSKCRAFCLLTSPLEDNAVCGTDGIDYFNPQRLECISKCTGKGEFLLLKTKLPTKINLGEKNVANIFRYSSCF